MKHFNQKAGRNKVHEIIIISWIIMISATNVGEVATDFLNKNFLGTFLHSEHLFTTMKTSCVKM